MIVELFGIPGAGKSTLVPALRQILEAHGLKVMTRWEAGLCCLWRARLGRAVSVLPPGIRLWAIKKFFLPAMLVGALRFSLKYPVFVRHVVTSQWRRRIPWWNRYQALRRFFSMAGLCQIVREGIRPDEVMLLDEGWVNQIVNLYVSELEPPNPRDVLDYLDYMDRLPPLDLVIHVQAPLATCIGRVFARGVPNRLEGKGSQAAMRFLANAAQATEMVAQKLSVNGRGHFAINNEGFVDQGVAELRHALKDF